MINQEEQLKEYYRELKRLYSLFNEVNNEQHVIDFIISSINFIESMIKKIKNESEEEKL